MYVLTAGHVLEIQLLLIKILELLMLPEQDNLVPEGLNSL